MKRGWKGPASIQGYSSHLYCSMKIGWKVVSRSTSASDQNSARWKEDGKTIMPATSRAAGRTYCSMKRGWKVYWVDCIPVARDRLLDEKRMERVFLLCISLYRIWVLLDEKRMERQLNRQVCYLMVVNCSMKRGWKARYFKSWTKSRTISARWKEDGKEAS